MNGWMGGWTDRQTVKVGRQVAGRTYRTLWKIVSGTVCNYGDGTFKYVTVTSFLIISQLTLKAYFHFVRQNNND